MTTRREPTERAIATRWRKRDRIHQSIDEIAEREGWDLATDEDVLKKHIEDQDWSAINDSLGVSPYLLALTWVLAREWKPSSILDPYVGFAPALLGGAARHATTERAVGIVVDERLAAVLTSASNQQVVWQSGRPEDRLSEIVGSFDLVTSVPPLGMKAKSELPGGIPHQLYRREYGYWIIASAAPRIGSDGRGLFVTTDALFFREDGKALRQYLAAQGVFVSAAISVSRGLAPLTNIDINLVILERRRFDTIFVGRVAPGGDLKPLFRNLLERRAAKAIENGALLPEDSYKGWPVLAAEHEVRRKLAASSVPLVPLGKIATEIVTVPRASLDEEHERRPNAFYIREIRGAVSMEPPAPQKGARSTCKAYLVALDERKARADFVAWWLGSDTGKASRQEMFTGVSVPRLSRTGLDELLVPLPPLEAQRRAVELHERVSALRAEAHAIDVALAGKPGDAKRLAGDLNTYWQDPVEVWTRRLPFPLASIIDRFIADSATESKVDRLLHFFEAFAEFVVAVQLAAARRNDALWQRVITDLAEVSPNTKHPLDEATFGSWTTLGFKLAKALRTQTQEGSASPDSDEDPEANARAALFAIDDPQFADVLCSKRLWGVLDRGRQARNEKAHGGYAGDRERQQLLAHLETLLDELRQATERTFVSAVLIQPGPAEFDGEIHLHKSAKYMVGPNANLRERPIESLLQLKAKTAYFVDDTDRISTALEVAPLFRMMASPESEENAIYFWNGGSQAKGFRYVSYHFGGEQARHTEDPALAQLVNELTTGVVERQLGEATDRAFSPPAERKQ
jgi:hypothetical protein